METAILTNNVSALERKKKGRYVLKKKDTSSYLTKGVILVFALVFFYFIFFVCEYKWDQVRPALIQTYLMSFLDFSTVTSSTAIEVFTSLVNTIALAFVTTIIGAVIGILFGLLAARNLSHPVICMLVRSFAGLIRAVPTIIWVLIFISGFGLTATTAIVGMSFHSVAYFIIWSAIIPVSFTKMISWIAMRSEMNFAAAVIIGPAVGVPGTIGSILNSYQRSGGYGTVGLCVLAIFVVALLFEIFITLYKQRSIVTE